MHGKINDVSCKRIECSSLGCIKSKDGTMLMENKEKLYRWSEHVEDLFKGDRCENPEIRKSLQGLTILKEEVRASVKKMNNGKVTEADNIPT
ncbi:endonuclease-reverse transcriptase [Plakobranchus ocellatus]|uniref:Endonuclease-reverse transcriptase n=1 Tax=Plakobranchus ocellatus TaxID=259542 RepID=A0AAV4DSN3_9GAST|nr:endonuclease-reverse transcriptase [Plakobranchus ocellatus]